MYLCLYARPCHMSPQQGPVHAAADRSSVTVPPPPPPPQRSLSEVIQMAVGVRTHAHAHAHMYALMRACVRTHAYMWTVIDTTVLAVPQRPAAAALVHTSTRMPAHMPAHMSPHVSTHVYTHVYTQTPLFQQFLNDPLLLLSLCKQLNIAVPETVAPCPYTPYPNPPHAALPAQTFRRRLVPQPSTSQPLTPNF